MRNTSGAGVRDWFKDGPLGTQNYRRQLGRSAVLGTALQSNQVTLVYTGATQNRAGAGLDRRAEGDAAASLTQVSCTYESGNEANNARPLQVRGKIAWGTDGHQCVAEFDFLNGTIVQVSGSSVVVSARIVDNFSTEDVLPTHDPLAAVRVGATIGYWGANRPPPTFTQQLRLNGTDPLPPNPTVALAIPRFARRLWWTGPVLSDVQWALGPSAVHVLGAVDPGGLTPRQAYERPGNATHLRISGDAGVTLNTLTWELVL